MEIQRTLSRLRREKILRDCASHSNRFQRLMICLLGSFSAAGVIPTLSAKDAQLYAAIAPWVQVVGLALAAGQHGKKLLAAAAIVLLLPMLFVLMLPALIFGGLTSSGAPGQPVLNDGSAITGNVDAIAAAIDEILAEGAADAEARAAQDFAGTGGDNYEIIQPFTVSSNTNSFIGQYRAAKEASWAEISLEDLKQLLRTGKSHL